MTLRPPKAPLILRIAALALLAAAACAGTGALAQAGDPAASLRPETSIKTEPRCDSGDGRCWWVDAQEQLHGAEASSPAMMQVAIAEGVESSRLARPVDALTAHLVRARFDAILGKLTRGWSVAARSIVSDNLHSDMQTLALAVHQVTSGWSEAVAVEVCRQVNATNDAVQTVVMPVGAVLSFNTIIAQPYMQNMLYQALFRYAMPGFLESSHYSWTAIPNQMSQSIHDLSVTRLNGEINRHTRLLLATVALDYLLGKDGEKKLDQDTLDQSVQVEKLTQAAGLPIQLGAAAATFKRSRDFRLLFASKLATVLGRGYSEHINNFIVTGHFGELAWQETGTLARGTIVDAYLRPGDPMYDETSIPGLSVDNRRKRTWAITAMGQLEATDWGRFTEGRLFNAVRLLLPYWDEPVVPWKGKSPVLKGNPDPLASFDLAPPTGGAPLLGQ